MIQRELLRRIEKNPRYSLRAFARAMGISHAALSMVISGKRAASPKLIDRFANIVGLAPDQKKLMIDASKRRSSSEATGHLIDMDTFTLIADWYHYAVLSLLDIQGAKFDARWISKKLSISQIKAKAIMQRLLRMDLVVKEGGVYRQTGAPIRIENKVSTAATRKFHRDVLAKAIDSLENDPIRIRDFSSMTFAMDEDLIPYATEKIRAFRRKLVADLERKSKSNRVYNLTVQIYPVSK